jgi:hypothetical protein
VELIDSVPAAVPAAMMEAGRRKEDSDMAETQKPAGVYKLPRAGL